MDLRLINAGQRDLNRILYAAQVFFWPVQGAAPDELLAQFEQSLAAVAGECRRCADRADAAAQIAEVVRERLI